METINNVVNTASKVIWGEQNATTTNETGGKEPASGLQGKGTATEPYDGGNAPTPLETAKTDPFTTTSSTTASTDITSPTKTDTTSTPNTGIATGTDKTTQETSTGITTGTDKTTPGTSTGITTGPTIDETSKPAMNPTSAAVGGEPKPLETTKDTGVTGSSAQKLTPKGSDVIPSESTTNTGVPPASGAALSQKHQGADRPAEAPKEDDPEAILKKRDPNDHSGEPMHMHDAPEKKIPATQEERRESKVGLPGGQEHGKDPKGTGEQWEKTTGLAADGGDFDATKPGAGKEAERLLEEKGVHRDAKGSMDKKPETAAGAADGGKEKVSKMEKLKEKLHIGHGHKDK